jgi:hypothetical protein
MLGDVVKFNQFGAILIKYYMNLRCHETKHVYHISCKDSILLHLQGQLIHIFKIYSFKIGYVLSLNSC